MSSPELTNPRSTGGIRRRRWAAGVMALAAAGAATTGAPAHEPPAPSPIEQDIGTLLEQHAALEDEVARMRQRIESLARAVSQAAGGTPAVDELAPLLSALDSESYRERLDATAAIRRALVDRMWLLLDAPELGGEARHRLKTLLIETSAMIRLTTVAADLAPDQRTALWNLLEAEPGWVLAALGDDPEEIRTALRRPPVEHDLAAEIVLSAILRDEMRPMPQIVALSLLEEATTPLLRQSLKSLISPAYQRRTGITGALFNQREQAAEEAVRILSKRPTPDLVAFFLAYLRTTRTWSARVELAIIDALVAMRAREAVPELIAISEEKRERLHGGQSYQGLMIKPGDCEVFGAALLLGLNLDELKVRRRAPRGEDDPPYFGFDAPRPQESPERKAALAAVKEAVAEAGPFDPIPGLQEALEQVRIR